MKIRKGTDFITIRIGSEYHHIYIRMGRNANLALQWGVAWWAVR